MQADPAEFLSNIFVRLKSDGGIRVILNLKHFNQQYVDKIHFKMESLKSAVNAHDVKLLFGLCQFERSILLNPNKGMDMKYFRLYWRGQKYQFISLILGLSSFSRCFTKILKPY